MKAANILVSTVFPPNVGVELGLWWGQGEGVTSVSGRGYFGKQHSHWDRHHRRSGSSDWGGCDTPPHTHTSPLPAVLWGLEVHKEVATSRTGGSCDASQPGWVGGICRSTADPRSPSHSGPLLGRSGLHRTKGPGHGHAPQGRSPLSQAFCLVGWPCSLWTSAGQPCPARPRPRRPKVQQG